LPANTAAPFVSFVVHALSSSAQADRL